LRRGRPPLPYLGDGILGLLWEESSQDFFPKLSLLNNPKEAKFYPKQFTKSVREATLIIFSYAIIKVIVWLHMADILPNII